MCLWRSRPKPEALLKAVQESIRTLRRCTEDQLATAAAELREHFPQPRPTDSATSIALVAESIRRTHGLEAYPCQLLGGLHLLEGRLIEMATGEGKTLVSVLPLLWFALAGKGVHVATVNSYLAERDVAFARPCLDRLGITVGLLGERASASAKRRAYGCDVTYGVGTEFGFDYLRDQLALREAGRTQAHFHEYLLDREPRLPALLQRSRSYAVIDEADSVLIDEARSPLIISTGHKRPHPTPEIFVHAADVCRQLRPGVHYTIQPRCSLTPAGHQRAHELLSATILPLLTRLWTEYIESALQAIHTIRRDVHYVISASDGVVIVDEFTGRLCPDRTWRNGLHQAVEAHAGVQITDESSSAATITRHAYFSRYDHICGMTGTAKEAASELRSQFHLQVALIPPNRPCLRTLLADRIFRTRAAKLKAAAEDVARRHALGQPVLIGSRTIENSEAMASALQVECVVLNGKQDADEAAIIARAGQPGAITIATNMAGRGAHIPVPDDSARLGGLHVLGLERHESARIDRQLIGRTARQGQPGSAQFFLSLEDDLLVRESAGLPSRWTTSSEADELDPSLVSHFLRAQSRCEAADRLRRYRLRQLDEWLNELKAAL